MPPAAAPDPRTPVVVGVGQASERVDDPGYGARSAVELAADAAAAALADTGADPAAVADALDVVAGIRQFEISIPGAEAPLGRADNYPRAVARRVGAQPGRAVLEVVGGQGPQHLLTELAGAIAEGRHAAALLFGAEAISTARRFAGRDDRPDFTEHVEGDLEDRGLALDGIVTPHLTTHGLIGMPAQYALCEHARRARLGTSRAAYARGMGALFAPFTDVAAANPHAADPVTRTAADLVAVDDRNRMIADPYPRRLVARDQVNQGAAVLVVSTATADRLGIPDERRVYLHGHADLRERDLLDRPDLGANPAAVAAARDALAMAGIGADDLASIDLYSCFPIAVAAVCDGLGLAPDDPRGLTVTGGLPFFGGPGNDYSMHAIAATVGRLRAAPGTFGFVGANGGAMTKYSAGVYSTTPAPWRSDRGAARQAELDAVPAPPVVTEVDGAEATIETFTVVHDRSGPRLGIVVARLPGGERVLASTGYEGSDDDRAVLDLLTGGEPLGAPVVVTTGSSGTRVRAVPAAQPGWCSSATSPA